MKSSFEEQKNLLEKIVNQKRIKSKRVNISADPLYLLTH